MTVVLPRTAITPTSLPRATVLGVALAALTTVVWSGSFVTSRALHDSVPPVQQAFWRWLVALAAVAPFGARQAWRQRKVIRRHLGFVFLASLLGVATCTRSPRRTGCGSPISRWCRGRRRCAGRVAW